MDLRDRKALHNGAAKGAALGATIAVAVLAVGEAAIAHEILWFGDANRSTFRIVCLVLTPAWGWYGASDGFKRAMAKIEAREWSAEQEL